MAKRQIDPARFPYPQDGCGKAGRTGGKHCNHGPACDPQAHQAMGDSVGPGFELGEGLDVPGADDGRAERMPVGQLLEDLVAAPIRARPVRPPFPSFQQSRFLGEQCRKGALAPTGLPGQPARPSGQRGEPRRGSVLRADIRVPDQVKIQPAVVFGTAFVAERKVEPGGRMFEFPGQRPRFQGEARFPISAGPGRGRGQGNIEERGA